MSNQSKRVKELGTVLLLCTALLTAMLPTSAFFSRNSDTVRAEGAPIAQRLSVKAYRDIPYTGRFIATDREGDAVSFCLATQPKHGSVTCEEDRFVYTPSAGYLGNDSFTFFASDPSGHVSLPAEVRIRVERTRSGVKYDDMAENSAYTAAIDLAEHGVFFGSRIADRCFFEPERSVSRGEFVAMALAAADAKVLQTEVTGFCDDDAIPTWAKGCAVGALQCGLVRGVGTAEGIAFCADSDITLAEAATIINRLLSVTDVSSAGEIVLNDETWCAQAVMNLESVSVLPVGAFSQENPQPLNRAEAAKLLSSAISVMESKAGSRFLKRILD